VNWSDANVLPPGTFVLSISLTTGIFLDEQVMVFD